MSVEFCIVIVRFPNGTKRVTYMIAGDVSDYVADKIATGGFQSIAIRSCSQAQFIRHTGSD